MPNYSNTPPAGSFEQVMRMYRVPATPAVVLTITSREMIGCPVHWYKGRSLPCEGDSCIACGEALAWRWKAWIGAIAPPNNEHVLLELTAAPAKLIAEFSKENGTLRGAVVRCSRVPERANGRVLLQIKMPEHTMHRMPKPPNIELVLSRIWQIPIAKMQAERNPGRMTDQLTVGPVPQPNGR